MDGADIHQHFLPEEFRAALAARKQPPRLHDGQLDLGDQGRWPIDVSGHTLERRLALLDRLELERAVVSLQPTFGADWVDGGEGEGLAAEWERGMLEVAAAAGGRIVPLAARGPAEGFAGLCVDARALLDLDRLAPRLDALGDAGGFLFVHPGNANVPPGAPVWWAAVVDYTAQMQAAYAAWLAAGAARWPDLDVVFAILAGGAPIQLERMESRGVAARTAMLPRVWFDTASYGKRALELAMSTFGVERMLFGSDTPVVDPEDALITVRSFGDAVANALIIENIQRLGVQ
ncbi:MAG: 6-methylsalicylate decarboxylase [Gaiellaceae bacterium]|jgi:predicted TIM-barrel fold metal-dependent hydrolase|nr:6-methylsalicylate decarboxylase [Gaiellaceae bacterium]MDX6468950.1 6-methylsalicylate decarboxylase [Gaiellaceae bacterium]